MAKIRFSFECNRIVIIFNKEKKIIGEHVERRTSPSPVLCERQRCQRPRSFARLMDGRLRARVLSHLVARHRLVMNLLDGLSWIIVVSVDRYHRLLGGTAVASMEKNNESKNKVNVDIEKKLITIWLTLGENTIG